MKTYKMAAMTSSKQHFQNLRKASFQNFDKIMWSKFYQNRPNSVQIKGCDRQTHTHTHTHTHKQTHTKTDAQTRLVQDLNIQSSEMAEYKKRKGDKQKHGKRFRERKRE